MVDETNTKDKSNWAIGGGTLLGLGVGMVFIKHSALAFVGCLIAGIGFNTIQLRDSPLNWIAGFINTNGPTFGPFSFLRQDKLLHIFPHRFELFRNRSW